MKCKDCPDFYNGFCTSIGEANCAFPVSPETECILRKIEDEEEQNNAPVKMPFEGMKWEDIKRRYADKTGVYIEMKDGSVLHSTNGAEWVSVSPVNVHEEQEEEFLPGDEPTEDEFCGTEQDSKKLAICRHISKMANAIKRAAPYHIQVESSDLDDNGNSSWALTLDLHSPAVFISVPLRKRLCEIILAADQVKVTAVPEENRTRFSFVVTDLWRE